jgi:hypothetical protein
VSDDEHVCVNETQHSMLRTHAASAGWCTTSQLCGLLTCPRLLLMTVACHTHPPGMVLTS